MRNLLGSLILIAIAAGPASACINDTDTDESESEFQKRYKTEVAEPAARMPGLAATSGALLLIGGAVIVRKRIRA